jgi:hypothetical protein
MFLAVTHSHADSLAALRVFFGACLVVVLFSGLHIFRNRQKFFARDPNVAADHYGARNLRLWQVILVWILAVDLLLTMLWRLEEREDKRLRSRLRGTRSSSSGAAIQSQDGAAAEERSLAQRQILGACC